MYRDSPLIEPRRRRRGPSSIQRPLSEPYAQLMHDYARSPTRVTTPLRRPLTGAAARPAAAARARFTPLVAAISLCSSVALALWCVIRFFLRRRR